MKNAGARRRAGAEAREHAVLAVEPVDSWDPADHWQRVMAALLAAGGDGTLARVAGPEKATAMVELLERHGDLGWQLFSSGFQAAQAMMLKRGVPGLGDDCPIHGPGGCHRTVGRA